MSDDIDIEDLIESLVDDIKSRPVNPDKVSGEVGGPEGYSNVIRNFIGETMLKAMCDIESLSMDKGDIVEIVDVKDTTVVVIVEGDSEKIEVDSKVIVNLIDEDRLADFY